MNAGPDTTVFAGAEVNDIISITDPGSETASPAGWQVSVDWDGVAGFDDVFNVTTTTFNLADHMNLIYGMGDIGDTFTVTVQVSDYDGGIAGTDTFDVEVVEDTLRVTSFVWNASGFDVTFNRDINLSTLNLYSGLPGGISAADVTLVGASVGNVKGSIVWNGTTNTLSFVKTGGVLAADTYDVTLESGAAAIKCYHRFLPRRQWRLHRGR